jgi:hypothetical protein
MIRFTLTIALFLGLAACNGCDSSSSSDGSAQAQDAGYDGDSQD